MAGLTRIAVLAVLASAFHDVAANDLMSTYVEGVTMVVSGAHNLAGYLEPESQAMVIAVGGRVENLTDIFVSQYMDAKPSEEVVAEFSHEEMNTVDALNTMLMGGGHVYNATYTLANDAVLLEEVSNTTYLATMSEINDNLIKIATAFEMANADASRRRLLAVVDCSNLEEVSESELWTCASQAAGEFGSGLQSTQNDIYMQQYMWYCEPYIRDTYSSDLKEDFDEDKTMYTCNDFSLFGMFGSTRCSECIMHQSEDTGEYVTQEDCRTFDNDEQQWYLDEVTGGFMVRNDEEDKHCITAPTNSTTAYGRSTFYTMQECSKTDTNQMFEVLELDTMTTDPRIMLKVAGSGTPGMCMTTREADDDDDMEFVSAPCICAKSQLIRRDD